MTAAEKHRLISVEEYLAAERDSEARHEFVAGAVFAMAGARNAHNIIAGNLFGLLHARLRGKPCHPFQSDTKVRIQMPRHTRFYYPDGMVVCDENPQDETYQDKPVVIAEVLSASTRRTDQLEKCEAYLTIPSLGVYLLVEQEQAKVLVHRRQEDGIRQEVYSGLDAVIPLPEVETELPLADLYDRVEFTPEETGDELLR